MFGFWKKKSGLETPPVASFNAEAVLSEPPAHTTLKKQNWELGIVNGTIPSLRVNLLEQNQSEYQGLIESLNDNGIPFVQRVRTSTSEPIIEVRGATDFYKLSKILGEEIMSEVQRDFDISHVKAINWQQGPQDHVLMTIHADSKLDQNVRTVSGTLERLGISSRTHSQEPSTIIVCGKDMAKLNNIVGLKGPVEEWAAAFSQLEPAPATLDA